MKIKLTLPLKQIRVTQLFGMNWVDFYQKMGLKGHTGIDFRTKRKCPVYASHDGKITWAGKDGTGGVSVQILTTNKGEGYYTVYYHLYDVNVKAGQKVKTGDLIGRADNTGKYTTGDHLHFGLKRTLNGATINKDNGYRGAIDPAPFFTEGKHWNKSRTYHRYGREQVWITEFWFRFAPQHIHNRWTEGGRYVHKLLKRIGHASPFLSCEESNAIIYGGWDIDTVLNPSMYDIWTQLKKDEYIKGQKPFS